MNMVIRSRAPLRISLGGGGTDVSPYTEEYGGVALNAAINKYSWGSLDFTHDGKIHLHSYDYNQTLSLKNISALKYDGKLDLLKAVIKHMYNGKNGINLYLRTDVGPRSGLGGSASAFVAAIGLFNHIKGRRTMSPYEIAEFAYKLEREELKVPGGRQDQYATVFGGFNFMEFKGHDFVRVTPLKIKKDYLLELETNTILVRIVPRKMADDVLADQRKNVQTGKTLEAMHSTKELAYEMKDALLGGDLDAFGGLLHRAWEEKKKFSKLISNPEIDRLYSIARKNGAIGGKITGAGGGGHMIFYCKFNTEQKVKEALAKAGAIPVDFSFDFNGLQTWEVV